jgi:ketosteroid isomerase-like protein
MRIRIVFAVMFVIAAFAGRLSNPLTVVSAQKAATPPQHAPEPSADAAEVLALDQKIGTAVTRGETAYVDSVPPSDFVMVHGDGWTNGGKPLLTDTKQSMLKRVTSKYYDVLDFDSVKVEMHGDVAITYGRYLAHTTGDGPKERSWFSVWYERVYAKRDGKWIYLSHRTVHGPTFGADRQSVSDK